MPNELIRWSDDRLDDLAQIVRNNDERLDTISGDVDKLWEDRDRRTKRSDREFQFWMIVISTILSNIAVAIGIFVK